LVVTCNTVPEPVCVCVCVGKGWLAGRVRCQVGFHPVMSQGLLPLPCPGTPTPHADGVLTHDTALTRLRDTCAGHLLPTDLRRLVWRDTVLAGVSLDAMRCSAVVKNTCCTHIRTHAYQPLPPPPPSPPHASHLRPESCRALSHRQRVKWSCADVTRQASCVAVPLSHINL
jgi:hypothetical protein